MQQDAGGMRRTRTKVAVVALLAEAALAVLMVLVHYGFTAQYGDVTDLAAEGWSSRLSSGAGGVGLVVVLAVVAVALLSQRWARVLAVAIPVLLVAVTPVVTSAALQEKLTSQYGDTPQCVDGDFMGPGPGADAAQESQQAFESIDHIGHFSGGGGSGVGGCDRSFVVIEDVDVLQHYRAALPGAGWHVVADGERNLRAERDGMALVVVVCGRGGVVWAGPADISGGARCTPEH
jgi:hypothetical protein